MNSLGMGSRFQKMSWPLFMETHAQVGLAVRYLLIFTYLLEQNSVDLLPIWFLLGEIRAPRIGLRLLRRA